MKINVNCTACSEHAGQRDPTERIMPMYCASCTQIKNTQPELFAWFMRVLKERISESIRDHKLYDHERKHNV